jgi:hypothetical protein
MITGAVILSRAKNPAAAADTSDFAGSFARLRMTLTVVVRIYALEALRIHRAHQPATEAAQRAALTSSRWI